MTSLRHVILEGANLVGKTMMSARLQRRGFMELRSFHNAGAYIHWSSSEKSRGAEETMLHNVGVPYKTFVTPLYIADLLEKVRSGLAANTVQDRSMFTSLVYGVYEDEEFWTSVKASAPWRQVFRYWLDICAKSGVTFVHMRIHGQTEFEKRARARSLPAGEASWLKYQALDDAFHMNMASWLGDNHLTLVVDGISESTLMERLLEHCDA